MNEQSANDGPVTDHRLDYAKLIELVQQRPAEELTLEEIQSLRRGLVESADLRSALVERLQMEGYLAAAFGRCDLLLDDVLDQARNQQAAGRWLPLLAIALSVMFLAGGVMLLSRSVLFPVVELGPVVARPGFSSLGSEIPSEADVGVNSPVVPETAGGESPVLPKESPAEFEAGEAKPERVALTPPVSASLPLEIAAERFTAGSVSVDNAPLGGEEIAFLFTEATPSFVEFEFDLPEGGKYELRLRYAAFESRPLKLTLNGSEIASPVASEATGGWLPDSQKWSVEGDFTFTKGKNRLRLDGQPAFPHLSRLLIVEKPPVDAVAVATAPNAGGNEQAENSEPVTGNGSERESAVPAGPWAAALAGEVRPAVWGAFRKFDFSKQIQQQADLEQWFRPVAGESAKFYQGRVDNNACGGLDGVFDFVATWEENTVLKFAPAECERLRLHLFHGRQGVTVSYYRNHDDRWAAYATTRLPGAALPQRYALTATDDQRNRRTEPRYHAPYELRWQAGEVIVSRGDVPLVRAPLAGVPERIIFAGKTLLPGLELYPSAPLDLHDLPPGVTRDYRPADLSWHDRLGPGARLERHGDGSVTLDASGAEQRGWVATPLVDLNHPDRELLGKAGMGLAEVVLRLEGVTPGMGVFLGRTEPGKNPEDAGNPHEAVLFTRDRRTGWTCTFWGHPYADFERDVDHLDQALMSPVSNPLWVKLTSNCGVTRFWISVDGEHWAEPEFPQTSRPRYITHVGIMHPEKRDEARLTMKAIAVRPLERVLALAPADVRDRAPTVGEQASLSAWVARVLPLRPADVAEAQWLRACALRTLATGCTRDFGWELLRRLFESADDLPGELRLAALENAAVLFPIQDDNNRAQHLKALFFDAAAATEAPFSAARLPLMRAPLVSWHRISPLDKGAIRAELLQLLHNGRWHEVIDACRRLRFFEAHRDDAMIEWADFIAQREVPGAGAGAGLSRLKPEWQPPLVEELSKEAYNLQAELRAILESDSLDDAARMITNVEPHLIEGVAPSFSDRQLLVSLPVSLRLAASEHPDLRESMQRQFGDLATLRVRQAIAAGDEAGVSVAAMQFGGTPASAEARQWLGDRALSAGQFRLALAEYERAEDAGNASIRHDLAARRRLAGAFLGRDLGTPPTRSVRLGDVMVAADEFESICQEIWKRTSAGAVSLIGEGPRADVPEPGEYRAERRSRFDGPGGQNPGDRVNRFIGQYNTPWWEQQAAFRVVDDILFLSNRFSLAAFHLSDGKRLWQTAPIPGFNMRRTHDFPLVPMQPLVTEDRIYARLLCGSGATIACFGREKGDLLWTASGDGDAAVISDPLPLENEIAVLVASWDNQRECRVTFTRLDAETGEVTWEQPLLQLRESWKQRWNCQWLPLDEGMVVVIGGTVVACDDDGRTLWVRRQVTAPLEIDPLSTNQHHQAPLAADGLLYTTQPGAREVLCLEAETGRLMWRVVRTDLRRLLGLTHGRLLLETETGVESLDQLTGRTQWSTPLPERSSGYLLDDQKLLIALSGRSTTGDGRPFPTLAWFDLATGTARGSANLPDLREADLRFGPLVSHGDRLWAFHGRGINDVHRDLLELKPTGEPADEWQRADPLTELWLSEIDDRLRGHAAMVLPEWRLLANQPEPSGLRDSIHGEEKVMLTMARPDSPVLWARWVELPAASRVRVEIYAGNDPGRNWELEVGLAGESMWRTTREWGGDSKPWARFAAEFVTEAPRSGWLTIRGTPVEGETQLYWKRLELRVDPR